MLTQIINGQILTPQGWLKDGSVLISDGKILEVSNSDLAVIGATVVDAKGMYIIPGFVAMNIHGGGGYDFKECTEEAFLGAVNAHMKYGATCIFPTLAPLSMTEIRKGVALCESAMAEKNSPVLGLLLEGPYLFLLLFFCLLFFFLYWKVRIVLNVGMQVRNYRGHWILPVMSVRKVFWLPFLIRRQNLKIFKQLMKPVLRMRLISTMLCPDSISVVNINMKER